MPFAAILFATVPAGAHELSNSLITVDFAKGGSKQIVKMEHLCFYDAKSWPSAKRNAGKLPQGCAPSTP